MELSSWFSKTLFSDTLDDKIDISAHMRLKLKSARCEFGHYMLHDFGDFRQLNGA
jgi:hypothetical protein